MISPKEIEYVLDYLNLAYRWVDPKNIRVDKGLMGNVHIAMEEGQLDMEAYSNSININRIGMFYFLYGLVTGVALMSISDVGSWKLLIPAFGALLAIFQYFSEQTLRRTIQEIKNHLRNIAPEKVPSAS